MKKIYKGSFTIVIFLSYALSVYVLFNMYYADVLFKRSAKLLEQAEISLSLARISEALERNPNEPIYYRQRAKVYLFSTLNQDNETRNLLKRKAVSDLEAAYALNPKNLATLRNSVPLYYFLATNDLQKTYGPENIDLEYLPQARDYYSYLADISPQDVGIQVLLAKYQNRLSMDNELSQSVARIKKLRPELLEWHESLRNIDVGLRNPPADGI